MNLQQRDDVLTGACSLLHVIIAAYEFSFAAGVLVFSAHQCTWVPAVQAKVSLKQNELDFFGLKD